LSVIIQMGYDKWDRLIDSWAIMEVIYTIVQQHCNMRPILTYSSLHTQNMTNQLRILQ
jgi:hypothetical protein